MKNIKKLVISVLILAYAAMVVGCTPFEPDPPTNLNQDYQAMSFSKYGDKIYFINALKGNTLNVYDLNTGILSENPKIRIRYDMAGYTFNSLCVAGDRIFFVSDTSVFSADLNGDNIVEVYKSEHAWASLSQLEYKNSMLYFSETVTDNNYKVVARLIELDTKNNTSRVLFEGARTFKSGYEQWDLPCPFTYSFKDETVYFAFGKIYTLDIQSLGFEIFYENDTDIFSVRATEDSLLFVTMDHLFAKVYNKYNITSQELIHSHAKGAGYNNYPYNYKKSGVLFLDDAERTIYTDTSASYNTLAEHYIAVESVFDETVIFKEFWNETNYSSSRKLSDSFAFDGMLAFLDVYLGVYLYYDGGLITLYEPDSVLFTYRPQSINELKSHLDKDIYLFSGSLLNELQLESFYFLQVSVNKAKSTGHFNAFGYYNYQTQSTIYRCEVAYRVNIGAGNKNVFDEWVSPDTEVISKLNHNDNKYLITLFYNTPDKSMYTYEIHFYMDNCFYAVSIHAPSGKTLSKSDLEKMAKSIAAL